MAEYVAKYTCGSCKNYEYKSKNEKGYCLWYRAYYYADDSCKHWEEAERYNSSGNNCFLTTACCEYKGLQDDCYELMTLRNFRDQFLLQNDIGKELVTIYYKVAPEIVDKINEKNDKEVIYNKIYEWIKQIVQLIEEIKYDDAIGEYVKLLFWTQKNTL